MTEQPRNFNKEVVEQPHDPFASFLKDLRSRTAKGEISPEGYTIKKEAVERIRASGNPIKELKLSAAKGDISAEEFEALKSVLGQEIKVAGRETAGVETRQESGVESSEEKAATQKAAGAVEELVETKNLWNRFREKISGKIKTPEMIETLRAVADKKILGIKVGTFLASAGFGGGTRFAVRHGLGLFSGGTGYILSMTSGALAGGIIEGTKAYREASRRLQEAGPVKIQELEEKITSIRESKRGDVFAKLEAYRKLKSEEATQGMSKTQARLYEELRKDFKIGQGEKWKACLMGALKGAAVGAFGGLIGGGLSHLAESYFGAAGEGTKEGLKSAKDAAKQAGLELDRITAIEDASMDAYNKVYDSALENGIKQIQEKTFTVVAQKGEGTTHIARKLIHDYIVTQRNLGNDINLGKGELIYAEDALRRIFGQVNVEADHIFSVNGQEISEVIKKSGELSLAQIENIEKESAAKVLEKTWQEMMDYEMMYNSGNGFAGEAFEKAKEAAAQASVKASRDAAENFAKFSAQIAASAPDVVKAKDAWYQSKWLKYIGAGVVGGGIGGAGYYLGRRYSPEIQSGIKKIVESFDIGGKKENGAPEGPEKEVKKFTPSKLINLGEKRKRRRTIREMVDGALKRSKKIRKEVLAHGEAIKEEPELMDRLDVGIQEPSERGPAASPDSDLELLAGSEKKIDEVRDKHPSTRFFFSRGITPKEQLDGVQKLAAIIDVFPEETIGYRIFIIGKINEIQSGANITLKASSASEEMKTFLEQAIRTTEPAIRLKDEILRWYGVSVSSSPFISVGEERSALEVLQEALRTIPRDVLGPNDIYIILSAHEGAEVKKLEFGGFSVMIDASLGTGQMEKRLIKAGEEIKKLTS